MAFKWKLGETLSGYITRTEPLPTQFGSGTVETNIHGEDYATVEVIKDRLNASEQANWKEAFREIVTFAVLDNDSLPWDHPGAVLFAGWVNKLKPQLRPGIIELQLTGLSQHTKARIAGEKWQKQTDPSDGTNVTGATYTDVMINLIKRCFSNDNIPAGMPTNPQVLGTVPATNDGPLYVNVNPIDARTYFELLDYVANTLSGLGIEWRLVPRWADAYRNRIVWDLIIGTNAVPHINEDKNIALQLSENSAKFSSWETLIDSNELYSKLYIQSKTSYPDDTSGADLTPAAVSQDEFPILIERFFNPGVELTDEQMTEQINARIAYAAKSKYTVSFTVEENLDPSEWKQNLGKTVSFTGVPGTISEGHEATVRIIGISFTPGQGTVKVEVSQLGPNYPRLPSLEDLGSKKTINDGRVSAPVTTTPTAPTPTVPVIPPFSGVDGVLNPGDLWGDAGHNPWDGLPGSKPTIAFDSYSETTETFTNWDGVQPIHPSTMFQTQGNRIYGLDHFAESHLTYFEGSKWYAADQYNTLTPEQVNARYGRGKGLLPNGKPNGGWTPFYIKKTYVVDGKLGPVETMGTIPAEKLDAMAASFGTHPAFSWNYSNKKDSSGNTDWFATRYINNCFASNWIIGDRYYFCLGTINFSMAESFNDGDWTTKAAFTDLNPWASNSKVSIISTTVDPATGAIGSEWRDEKTPPNFGMPITSGISKMNSNVIFTSMMPIDGVEVGQSNISASGDGHRFGYVGTMTFDAYADAAEASTGWRPKGIFGTEAKSWSLLSNLTLWCNVGQGYGDADPEIFGVGNLVFNPAKNEYFPFTGFGQSNLNKAGSHDFWGFAAGGYCYGVGTNDQRNNPGSPDAAIAKRIRLVPDGQIPADAIWVSQPDYQSGITCSNPIFINGHLCVSGKNGSQPFMKAVKIEDNGDMGALQDIVSNGAPGFGYSDGYMTMLGSPTYIQFDNNRSPYLGANVSASRIFVYDGWVYTFKNMPQNYAGNDPATGRELWNYHHDQMLVKSMRAIAPPA